MRTRWTIAIALTAALLAGAPPAAAARPASPRPPALPKQTRTRWRPAQEADALVRERTGLRTRDEQFAAAAAAGPLTLSGSERLSGVVYASSLTIADGSAVVLESRTTLVVAGDVTIDGDVTCELKPLDPGAKLPVPPERENEDTVFVLNGRMVLNRTLRGADGRAGADDEDLFNAIGENGRRGQGFVLVAGIELVLNADLIPGRGGDGGRAETNVDGVSPSNVFARGGNGGQAGGVSVSAQVATDVVANGGRILLRRGGKGGDAVCVSGTGRSPEDGSDCGKPGGRAGTATATGGNAGAASFASVGEFVRFVDPLQEKVAPGVVFGVLAEDTEIAARIVGGASTPHRVLDADGGDGTAAGGAGGAAPDCAAGDGDCAPRGRRPGTGGRGGDANAFGGHGGDLPFLIAPPNAFAEDTLAAFSFPVFASAGGSAYATGGNGFIGANAAPAQRPAAGGRGGDGGRATARPGQPGRRPLIFPLGTNAIIVHGRPIDPLARPADVDPVDFQGLLYEIFGEVSARGGDSGGGGNGGDCCGRPGGRAGAGGPPGEPGLAFGYQPSVVRDAVGTAGSALYESTHGTAGGPGLPGIACPPQDDPNDGGGTLDDPFTPPVLKGPCADLFGPNPRVIVGYDFYLPGSNEGLARPPRSTLLEFGATVFDGPESDVRVEIFINGTRVVNLFIAELENLQSVPRFYVRTPATGDLCVEIRVDGVATQRLMFMTSGGT